VGLVGRMMKRMRPIALSVCALALVVSGGALPAYGVGSPPVTFPSSPKGLTSPVTLPTAIDPPSPYLPQTSCNPGDMTGVKKLRTLVMSTYAEGGWGAISHGCTEGTSEHSEGRAWDWMVDVGDSSERAAAANFLAWVTANHGKYARRLGIMYVIYNEKIWSIYREDEGWRANSGHKDHVHISFSWNGARGNTSFWTGKVGVIDYGPCFAFVQKYAMIRNIPRTGSCRATSSVLKQTSLGLRQYGNRGSATVTKAQKLLGVTATSNFDSATWTAVKAYQLAHDLPYTGVLDQPTWASLSPADVTSNVVAGYTAAQAAAYGRAHYASTSINRYTVGKSVLFLQTALRMPSRDRNGYFTAKTLAAVKAFQTDVGLAVTGVVTSAEWAALPAPL
jgi:peptidoglycan hydrolase-like protein with peptidoglycan-binding domain